MTLQELDERAVETIVDFFYSGEIEISENNVQELLPVTCILQVLSVQEACCEFLKRQLSTENCLGRLINSAGVVQCAQCYVELCLQVYDDRDKVHVHVDRHCQ